MFTKRLFAPVKAKLQRRGLRRAGRLRLARNPNETNKNTMSLLVIFYWILLLLWAIGAFSAASWLHWPYANAFILLILFVIIGIKILKPTW